MCLPFPSVPCEGSTGLHQAPHISWPRWQQQVLASNKAVPQWLCTELTRTSLWSRPTLGCLQSCSDVGPLLTQRLLSKMTTYPKFRQYFVTLWSLVESTPLISLSSIGKRKKADERIQIKTPLSIVDLIWRSWSGLPNCTRANGHLEQQFYWRCLQKCNNW